jgi:hypothetical protein
LQKHITHDATTDCRQAAKEQRFEKRVLTYAGAYNPGNSESYRSYEDQKSKPLAIESLSNQRRQRVEVKVRDTTLCGRDAPQQARSEDERN